MSNDKRNKKKEVDKQNKQEEPAKRDDDLLEEKDLESVSGGFYRPSPGSGGAEVAIDSYIGETEKNLLKR